MSFVKRVWCQRSNEWGLIRVREVKNDEGLVGVHADDSTKSAGWQ